VSAWIKTSERLPEDWALLYWRPAMTPGTGSYAVGKFTNGYWHSDENEDGPEEDDWNQPDYWQALPEPPA